MDLSERNLIEHAQNGSRAAFEELYARHKTRVYNYLLRLTGSHDGAAEYTQETFVRAYRTLSRYRHDGRFMNWLYTIAHNVVRNERRAARVRKVISLFTPLASDNKNFRIIDTLADSSRRPDNAARGNEFRDKIHAALMALPAHQREVLVLCDMEQRSYDEAAAILGVRKGTVASRLSRARAGFRALLDTYYENRTETKKT